MIEHESVKLDARGSYSLSLLVVKSPDPKACVQVVHGMEEHKERYIPLADFLAEHGYHVILSNLRGHGEDATLLSHIADKDGDTLLIRDQQMITRYIKERFPGLELILFAHSMGTIISRVLLQTDSGEYSGVALSGYVAPNAMSGIAVKLGSLVKTFKGPKAHSKMLTNLALGPYTKAVKDRKTDLDWLSYDEDNVRKYIADPLCGVEFTVGSYCALFRLLDKMGKADLVRNVNASLPILLLGGVDDPCTGGEKGRADSKALLQKSGFRHVSAVTYKGMRHEILNEKEKDKVFRDILEFMDGIQPEGASGDADRS